MKKTFVTLVALLAAFCAIAQCTPAFTYTIAPVNNNLLYLQMTNTTVVNLGFNQFVTYSYNYGDGNTGATTTHNYTAAGTYTVTLNMTLADSNNIICQNSVAHVITVSYTDCGSSFTFSYGLNGLATFTASNPANTPTINYAWDYGDNTGGSGSPATHTYLANGYYIITLTATAPAPYNCTYTNSGQVHITNLPISCVYDFAHFTSSVSYNTATFTNTSTAPPITNIASSCGVLAMALHPPPTARPIPMLLRALLPWGCG